MTSVNMSSIITKAKTCINTPKKQNEIRKIIDNVMFGQIRLEVNNNIHTPEDAAEKFIEVLHNEINSSGLSTEAAAAISNLKYGSAQKIGRNTYIIGVYFANDMSRPSLDEATYGGIDDLAALLNNGVDHIMNPVHGLWHGHKTESKTEIKGTHFMELARRKFMCNYASDYNVTDITINGI